MSWVRCLPLLVDFSPCHGACHELLGLQSTRGVYTASTAGLSLSTGELLWCTLADEQPFAVITESGTPYNGSYYVGVSSQSELLPVEETFFRGSFLKINVLHIHLYLSLHAVITASVVCSQACTAAFACKTSISLQSLSAALDENAAPYLIYLGA